MALLLETTWGDLVIDLDVEGSPALCLNILKLAKARYYTSTLVYNVQPNRFCQLGDPRGDGTGGGCIHGLLDNEGEDITSNKARFLKSKGRILSFSECRERGRVVATEMNGIPDTIGSQFLITLQDGEGRALDGYIPPHHGEKTSSAPRYLSLGVVTEDDDNVLDRIHNAYCDANGRPYGDIRIERALVIHDPFQDPLGLQELMERRGIVCDDQGDVMSSPSCERPPEERVEIRIPANQVEEEEDEQDPERAHQREEEIKKKEDTSRAVVLEMLGDLPSADIKAPEEVLFVCKLNPITQDEDLELIFSRFDPNVKVEIIRDPDTGASLQYAFCEFSTKKQCVEAYFKMNGALVDDRRIKVDFSQSVAKVWDKYNQKMKRGRGAAGRGGGHERGGPPTANRGRGGGRHFDNRPPFGGRGGQHPSDQGGFGPPRNEHGRNRENREKIEQQYLKGDDYYRHESLRTRGGTQGKKHNRSDGYSPGSEHDGHGRRSRSCSVSPDDRSHDHKRRKHSKKRHHHERSHRDNVSKRKRHDDDERRNSRRHDSDDEDHRNGRGERDGSHRSHGDDDQVRRTHRKHHRHRHDGEDKRWDEGKHRDDHKHRKRKHKESHRRSHSRSGSHKDK